MSPAETSRASLIEPATLMRIKDLQMRAKVVVEGFFSGIHRSPYHGFSVEFSEYRQYTPGDDPRYIDWRLFARSDRYYIKRFEDETNLRTYLLVDQSQSMQFGSIGYTKSQYAATTAATLAYFLVQQRDAVGAMTFAERVGEYLPARYRPGHLHRLMVCLERSLVGRATDLSAPLEQAAELIRRRGVIVLISDLLAPIETLQRNLGLLRSQGHEVIVFRILDPAEVDFSFAEPAMFEDMESGRQLYIDPNTARTEYQARFREHSETIQTSCRNLGIDFHQFTTDRALELTLFDFLNSRLRRGRQTQRRGMRQPNAAN